MGLVMSHTYNLSHTYLSHTPHTVKHPTSVALSIGIHIALCTSNVRRELKLYSNNADEILAQFNVIVSSNVW